MCNTHFHSCVDHVHKCYIFVFRLLLVFLCWCCLCIRYKYLAGSTIDHFIYVLFNESSMYSYILLAHRSHNPLCVCIYVCGDEKRKTKIDCINNVIHVRAQLSIQCSFDSNRYMDNDEKKKSLY